MHYDAALRVRELTQNIYDIGDEIAQYIDHISQAMADWDTDLVTDCLEELHAVVQEGRGEVRPGLAELNGLRQAFISGVRAGSMNGRAGAGARGGAAGRPADLPQAPDFPHPGRTLAFLHHSTNSQVTREGSRGVRGLAFADQDPADAAAGVTECGEGARPAHMASTASWRMWLRAESEQLTQRLQQLQEWVVAQTQDALEAQSVLLPQVYMRAYQASNEVVQAWREIVEQQPALAAAMRGEAPPAFLEERARVEAVVAKIQRRRRGAAV